MASNRIKLTIANCTFTITDSDMGEQYALQLADEVNHLFAQYLETGKTNDSYSALALVAYEMAYEKSKAALKYHELEKRTLSQIKTNGTGSVPAKRSYSGKKNSSAKAPVAAGTAEGLSETEKSTIQ